MNELVFIVHEDGSVTVEIFPENWHEDSNYVERLAWGARNGIAYCKRQKALEVLRAEAG